jgi:hypothetical protein
MADSKISALPASTTPLAGTEVLPIVQGGSTVKVAVSNLTAGRTIAVNGVQGSGDAWSGTNANVQSTNPPVSNGVWYGWNRSGGGAEANFVYGGSNLTIAKWDGATYTPVTYISNGNLVPATAAKGIDFTTNTPAAGMTSQLLNWYEEGTWTPAQGAGLTLVGAFSSTGKYTRIGRSVTISGTVSGATSVAVTAAGVITSNLPFTVGTAGHGAATNAANTAFASVICTTTNVTSAGAIAAIATITFSSTYFV